MKTRDLPSNITYSVASRRELLKTFAAAGASAIVSTGTLLARNAKPRPEIPDALTYTIISRPIPVWLAEAAALQEGVGRPPNRWR